MTPLDIRWIQRYDNYLKALLRLKNAVDLARQRPLSDLEEQGLIQAFEFTHELAWNTLKDFLESRGAGVFYGSKDATRAAFRAGLIPKGDVWMDMIKSRNLTTHTYDEIVAATIAAAIRDVYVDEFESLKKRLDELRDQEERS